MSKITCNKCNSESVKNSALGKEFFYCRTCKEEVKPLDWNPIVRVISYKDFSDMYSTQPRIIKRINKAHQ